MLGIIAGGGRLPLLIVEGMRFKGVEPFIITFNPELAAMGKDGLLLKTIDVARVVEFLRKNGVKKLIIAGVIPKKVIFDSERLDELAKAILQRVRIRDDHALLGVVVSFFESQGFEVVGYIQWIKDYVAVKGVMSKRAPSKVEEQEIDYGYRLAKDIAKYSFGQTVVLKNGVVLAVEAIEGTDEAIKRAGKWGGNGAVVVKVIKKGQDIRYDLPTVGPRTIQSMREAGARCLAVESGYTLMLDKKEMLALADSYDISVVGI